MGHEAIGVLVDELGMQVQLASHGDVMISDEAKDMLTMLKRELSLLASSLVDVKQWYRLRELGLARQIREVVYDVEDTLESWSMQRQMQKHSSALAREIYCIIYRSLLPVHRFIVSQVTTTGNQPEVPPELLINKEDPATGVRKIVGFEDDAETLISCLMEETEELDVISIIGMPGIGKTTLARKMLQNHRIMTKFPTRIWVNILPGLDPQILNHSCSEEFSMNGSIINDAIVQACLKRSRFLLVLDQVWSADTLRSVMRLLPNTGKVLITSRDTSVCADANVARKPHKLRFLNEEESWDLLQLEVFGKLDECPLELKPFGKCIAKSCEGSPLALVELATSLVVASSTEAARDLTKMWWKEVSENVTTYLTDYGQHRVFSSVELSYIELPECLRHCLLYLGVFPQGHEIPVRALARLWIAEGLIHDAQRLVLEATAEQDLEGTAEQYLCDLIHRNLVMVAKTYPNGQIKTCRLHKLIYGFCKYKAAHHHLYQEIKMSQGGTCDPSTPDSSRLCIYSNLSAFLSSRPQGQRVRSILCLNNQGKALQHKHSSTIHKCFKLLRVLECRCVSFTKFPTKLSKLMHLRYITLSCDDRGVIPESMASLRYLETLIVDTKSPSLKINANIWRMFKLRHLITQAALVVATRGKGNAGKNLQTLTRLSPGCCTEDVLERAPNLKTLGIRGQLAAGGLATLSKMERLQHLKLVNESPAAESGLHRLLHRNFFPPNMRRLTLSATYLGWESMSVLGKISSLEILKLKNNAFTGASWNTDADGFRGLLFLFIATADLVSWEASTDCFPSLKWLVVKDCERLRKIPTTVAKSLDTLDVEKVSQSAVESAREIERQGEGRLQLSIRHHQT